MTARSVLLVVALCACGFDAAAQQLPAPLPFPRSGGSPAPVPTTAPAAQPTTPVPAPARPSAPTPPSGARSQTGAPTDATIGVPGIIYPAAEFLQAVDIGKGQQCYLFGTAAAYADIVGYYRQTLKDGGRELIKTPGMQQFDLGKFQDQSMTYPPSVVVKDYSSAGGNSNDGYLQVTGTTSKRFKTVIQIVPMPGH